jgi:hypothetical protein
LYRKDIIRRVRYLCRLGEGLSGFSGEQMSKILILAIAISLLFVSGSFFGAQAGGKSGFKGCPLFSSSSCGLNDADRDTMAPGQERQPAGQGSFGHDTNPKVDFSGGFWQDMG